MDFSRSMTSWDEGSSFITFFISSYVSFRIVFLLSTSLSVNEMIFTDLLLNTLNTSHVLIDLLNVQVI